LSATFVEAVTWNLCRLDKDSDEVTLKIATQVVDNGIRHIFMRGGIPKRDE
jgi:hypothetical protein